MSRRHKHGKVENTPKPTTGNSSFVSTFGASVGEELKNPDDLMNWIIFGDPNVKLFSANTNDF